MLGERGGASGERGAAGGEPEVVLPGVDLSPTGATGVHGVS